MSNAFKLVAREEGVIHLTAMWELEVDNNFFFQYNGNGHKRAEFLIPSHDKRL